MSEKQWSLPGMSEESEDVGKYLNRLERFTNEAINEIENSYREEASEDLRELETYKRTYFREAGSKGSVLAKNKLKNGIDQWVKRNGEVTQTGYVENFIKETRDVLPIIEKYLSE